MTSQAIAALILLTAAVTVARAESIDIGSRLEPFVDDYLIDRVDGVELRLNHPTAREFVFRFDAPWEGESSGYVTVFRDSGKFRMYYRGSDEKGSHPEFTCVAESSDGIRWTRPKLGIVEFAGSKGNNIVWKGTGAHAFAPFKDTNPTAKKAELYKAVGPGSGDGRSALYAFVSADGYHWKQLQEKAIITRGAFDSQNLAFWDAHRREYVCYFRDFRNGVRDIKRSVSKDFVNWSEPEWLSYTGAPAEQLYTNAITPYPRAPHIYIGFPKRFVRDRKAVASHPHQGVSDGVFMSSRDGLAFHRWEEAFVRPGPDIENWTDRNSMAAWGMLELAPGEISLYYSRHYRHPDAGMQRLTVRTDGFASLHAGGRTGTAATRLVVFKGKELVINYATSAAGGVRVELQNESGAPVPGLALDDCPVIYGDEIEHVVKWKAGSDLSKLGGKPMRMKIELKDADLYSIRFR